LNFYGEAVLFQDSVKFRTRPNIRNTLKFRTFLLAEPAAYHYELTMKRNRLAKETSPYLLQHAQNPVDWYPWGTEALDAARREKKPIFLSIGYSACHWCHVMERESFEDQAVADLLNAHFIAIKVDREERPDIDHIYMGAVQALTGQGGWPLSVFLTPELEPFYGGTYFPPEDRHGLPAFKRLLSLLSSAWKERREEVIANATQLTQALKEIQRGGSELPEPETLNSDLLEAAVKTLQKSADPTYGGLGTAPKFFHSMAFRLALRYAKRSKDATLLNLVTHTLDHIADGGVRDHLGGGFHRYSTDAEWLVPHFEKMLYDNALLSEWFFEAYQATGKTRYASVGRDTLDYILRDLSSPEGGFFSTHDADSEGVEGKFYVWTHSEILEHLGEDLGSLFCRAYQVSSTGNWEGKNILHIKEPLSEIAQALAQPVEWVEDQLAVAKRKLLQRRNERVLPARDEKILLSWNGLALSALCIGYQTSRETRFLEAAQKNAAFLLHSFTSAHAFPSGKLRLLHCRKDGETKFNGYLDDYAFLLSGLIALHECDFDGRWLDACVRIADAVAEQFWEPSEQVFYFTAKDHESLISRPRESQDGATPSGQAIAIGAFLKLAKLTGRAEYEDIAMAALSQSEPFLRLIPTGVSQMLLALDWHLNDPLELAFFPGSDSESRESVTAALGLCLEPYRVFSTTGDHTSPQSVLLESRTAKEEKPTLYVCRGNTCTEPLVGLEKILTEIAQWKLQ
jgi:uncharacterized protein